jgi:NAD(P)H-flavin reductase
MPREFTSERAIQHHTELTGDTYLMEGTLTFVARQRLLSPGQYEIVEVRTGTGVRRAMLFRKAILKHG